MYYAVPAVLVFINRPVVTYAQRNRAVENLNLSEFTRTKNNEELLSVFIECYCMLSIVIDIYVNESKSNLTFIYV